MTKHSFSITIYIERAGDEVAVALEGIYIPGSRGQRVDGARFADPDEPSEIEITSSVVAETVEGSVYTKGQSIELSETETARAEEKIDEQEGY